MADDLKQTGKTDDTRIDPDQGHELAYWTGPMVKNVQRHLKG